MMIISKLLQNKNQNNDSVVLDRVNSQKNGKIELAYIYLKEKSL